jgi:hypothetical protein
MKNKSGIAGFSLGAQGFSIFGPGLASGNSNLKSRFPLKKHSFSERSDHNAFIRSSESMKSISDNHMGRKATGFNIGSPKNERNDGGMVPSSFADLCANTILNHPQMNMPMPYMGMPPGRMGYKMPHGGNPYFFHQQGYPMMTHHHCCGHNYGGCPHNEYAPPPCMMPCCGHMMGYNMMYPCYPHEYHPHTCCKKYRKDKSKEIEEDEEEGEEEVEEEASEGKEDII